VLSLNGYITLQVGAGILRRKYLLLLEALIGGAPGRYMTSHPRFVALYHSLILGWRGMLTTLLALLTYWSPLATSAMFTAYVLGPVAESNGTSDLFQLAAIIGYSVMIFINVAALLTVSFRVGRATDSLRLKAKLRLAEAKREWT
jgi:hypothetical protein